MSDDTHPVSANFASDADRVSVELSQRRTGMSFQRTRMSADRTLMSVIRTSLSLISFGFTIYQFFQHLKGAGVFDARMPSVRNFGIALVTLGVGMLVLGIGFHLLFMLGLRRERRQMKDAGLIHGESRFPVSLTLLVAVALLVVGALAIGGIAFGVGPFT
jgi:putative membrane protein